MKKKKILLISNMYPSKNAKHYGSFVKNTEELLKDNNYIVDKVIMTKHKNKIIKLFCYILFHLKVIIKGLFKNYDYLYVHFVSHSSLGAVIVKRLKKKTQLILNCHGNDVMKDLDEEQMNVSRSHKYMKYADKIVVPSQFCKKEVSLNYQIPSSKIFVYPSGGVDTDKFIKKDQKECRLKLGLDLNNKYIGFISRIEKHKGWDIFVEAINELVETNKLKDYKFLIVGSGVENEKLYSLIKELKLGSVIEIKDMVYQDDLVDIYNSLDVFVLPSYRKESLGLVGLESMSCEVFTITSDQYGPTDYIVNNKNGFTFKLGDYKDLALKINKYFELKDSDKEKILKESRNTALKYDTKLTKNKILEVFK